MFNFLAQFFKIFKSESKADNVTSVVWRLMKSDRVKVTFNTVSEYIKSHPGYPSFKCICDFFDEMNITNYPLRIDQADLFKLTDPFLSHVKDSGGKVLIMYKVDREQVEYADSLSGKRIMKTSKFLESWDVVVIVTKPSDLAGEPDYKEKRSIESVHNLLVYSPVPIFLFVFIWSCFLDKSLTSDYSLPGIIMIVTLHLAGLVFLLILLRRELNIKTNFTDKLCHIATNADCDAVIKSRASKIFGNITWADAGVAYFAGGIFSFFLLPLNDSLNLLSILGLLALPYPLFSILWQWVVIKKWCPFCLSVQNVIILESIVFFKMLKFGETSFNLILPLLAVFATVLFFALILKSLFILTKEKKQLKLENLKMKRDPEVFNFKLLKGERLNIPPDKHPFDFGDTRSNALLSVFLSLHCSACATKFDQLMRLIERNCKIKIRLIFSPSRDELSERIIKSVYISAMKGEKQIALKELETWYKSDGKTRLKIVPSNYQKGILDGFNEMIENNKMIFNLGKVMGVPAVFINGYPMPGNYSLEDIKYHISDLEMIIDEPAEIKV